MDIMTLRRRFSSSTISNMRKRPGTVMSVYSGKPHPVQLLVSDKKKCSPQEQPMRSSYVWFGLFGSCRWPTPLSPQDAATWRSRSPQSNVSGGKAINTPAGNIFPGSDRVQHNLRSQTGTPRAIFCVVCPVLVRRSELFPLGLGWCLTHLTRRYKVRVVAGTLFRILSDFVTLIQTGSCVLCAQRGETVQIRPEVFTVIMIGQALLNY